MTNDLTTVEGSFQQLIDDLENNLQEKGVDAEYDATTGIRGLVAKISEIESLPSYDIRFETHDLVKYYRDPDKQFYANVYDNGEKVTRTDINYGNDDIGTTLEFILNDSNNNSVTYSRRYSDADNAVKLNIQIPPGEYDIITNYQKDNSIFATTNHITVLPISVTFDTQDITMQYRDGTKFTANVYENEKLVTRGDISYTVNETTYTGTLLFEVSNGVYYCRPYSSTNGYCSINLNFPVGEYDITTTYKATTGEIFTTTNHISISE